MKRCLFCYKELDNEQVDYHPQCSKKIYGTVQPPILPYSKKDLVQLAERWYGVKLPSRECNLNFRWI